MPGFVIRNGDVFRNDFMFHKSDIFIENNLIVDYMPDNAEIIDAENLFVVPGLTDIHFHGCNGHDFCEGTMESIKAIIDYETRNGITTICPATMTLSEQELARIMNAAKKFHEEFPEFVGIDLEGPFVSPFKKGAQNPEYIAKPDSNMLMRLNNISGGLIKIALVAPEIEGAMKFIDESKNITKISIGHTNCNYETAKQAFIHGANHVTHLYNAMNPINHREPGPIIAAVENQNIEVEMICDGVHIHPSVVRNTLRMFGSDRVIFISDSMEAAGMIDGEYSLGGQKVIKNGRFARLIDGTIAGSLSNLMDCVRTAVKEMNIDLETAIKCAAVNPAKSINIYDNYGSIESGKSANLAALDKELNIMWVMNNGNII